MSPLGGIARALLIFACLGTAVGFVWLPIKAALEYVTPGIQEEKARKAGNDAHWDYVRNAKYPTQEELEAESKRMREIPREVIFGKSGLEFGK